MYLVFIVLGVVGSVGFYGGGVVLGLVEVLFMLFGECCSESGNWLVGGVGFGVEVG